MGTKNAILTLFSRSVTLSFSLNNHSTDSSSYFRSPWYAAASITEECHSTVTKAVITATSPCRGSRERFNIPPLRQTTTPMHRFPRPLIHSKTCLCHNLSTTPPSLVLRSSRYHNHHNSVHCTQLPAFLNPCMCLSCAVQRLGRHPAVRQVHSSTPEEKEATVRGRKVGV